MSMTRLAVIDTGQANERILNKKEYRADFRRVEAASLKRKTALASPEAKRLFARCFYSLQASMYFISHLGRAKLDHAVIERIEQDVRAALEAGTKEINDAIDQAEALLRHRQIEMLATYDAVPLVEEIGITSSFGRRYFEMIHKLDVIMPMLETLAIEEIITEREHERRRARFKRVILGVSTKARNFWSGVRRRMYEQDAKAAAADKGSKAPGGDAAASETPSVEPPVTAGTLPDGAGDEEPDRAQDGGRNGIGQLAPEPLALSGADEAVVSLPESLPVAAAA